MKCFLETKDKGHYWYSEAPHKPTSRSGHTSLLLPSLRGPTSKFGLFVFGGRDSGDVEMCGQWSDNEVSENKIFRTKNINSNLRDVIFAWCRRVPEIEVMIGLRHHAMVDVAPDCILVHGGEHFKSKKVFCRFSSGFYHLLQNVRVLSLSNLLEECCLLVKRRCVCG